MNQPQQQQPPAASEVHAPQTPPRPSPQLKPWPVGTVPAGEATKWAYKKYGSPERKAAVLGPSAEAGPRLAANGTRGRGADPAASPVAAGPPHSAVSS